METRGHARSSRAHITVRRAKPGDGQALVDIGGLIARIVGPDDGAERDIAPDATLRRLRVYYLATAGAHRRSGVATRLVGAAEAWGRERGARVVEASTYARSPVSMPFWKDRMGFAELTVNLRKDL